MVAFGIIGGQGAVATLKLHQMVVEAALAGGAVQDSDFPSLIVGNLSSSVLSEWGLPEDDEKACDFIRKHGLIFPSEVVDRVVVACNTLHVYSDLLAEVFGERFVSILDLVAQALPTKKRILVIGSHSTGEHKLFERNNFQENTFVYADSVVSTRLILAGMGGQVNSELAQSDVALLLEAAKSENCDAILLGCTDLSSFVISFAAQDILVIDALTVLADYITDSKNEKVGNESI